MSDSNNIQKLTQAGIIPAGYDKLSKDEKASINNLSSEEVDAIISASAKIGPEMLKNHAPHGMTY